MRTTRMACQSLHSTSVQPTCYQYLDSSTLMRMTPVLKTWEKQQQTRTKYQLNPYQDDITWQNGKQHQQDNQKERQDWIWRHCNQWSVVEMDHCAFAQAYGATTLSRPPSTSKIAVKCDFTNWITWWDWGQWFKVDTKKLLHISPGVWGGAVLSWPLLTIGNGGLTDHTT